MEFGIGAYELFLELAREQLDDGHAQEAAGNVSADDAGDDPENRRFPETALANAGNREDQEQGDSGNRPADVHDILLPHVLVLVAGDLHRPRAARADHDAVVVAVQAVGDRLAAVGTIKNGHSYYRHTYLQTIENSGPLNYNSSKRKNATRTGNVWKKISSTE